MDSDDEIYFSEDDDNYEEEGVQKTYRVLGEGDVKKLQDDRVDQVSSTISVSKDEAIKLLYYYRWNDSLLLDEWFDDEERVRARVGLVESSRTELCSSSQGDMITCGICFESYPHDSFYPTTLCGHLYCMTCWKGYLSVAIKDGPGCLSLRCPEPKCNAAVVDQGMIDKLASDDEKRKYARYLFRSYVEENRNMKWCPAPGCDNAVEFEMGSGVVYDVTCDCSHAFCWNCNEEAHSPVGCDMVADWILKNGSESRNICWIMENTKPCPKCKKSIIKGWGCSHVTCPFPCGYKFCWICVGSYEAHTGSCDPFDQKGRRNSLYDVHEEHREDSLQKYIHNYVRWTANTRFRLKAINDLHKTKTELAMLSHKLKVADTQLLFIVNAWEQIIKCRRVLKWTYVYGYYFPEAAVAKKTLFEYLQGQAEVGLQRLCHCAEQELSDFVRHIDSDSVKLDDEQLEADLTTFRLRLTSLTSAAMSYFDNLVRALENNLREVRIMPKRKQQQQIRTKFRSVRL